MSAQADVLGDKTKHLAAIHSLPSDCWPAAVQTMLDRGWSASTMRRMADRIQARAIRRAGELLRQIPPAKNQHDAESRAQEGALPSREQAATEAGMSEHQRNRIATVNLFPKWLPTRKSGLHFDWQIR